MIPVASGHKGYASVFRNVDGRSGERLTFADNWAVAGKRNEAIMPFVSSHVRKSEESVDFTSCRNQCVDVFRYQLLWRMTLSNEE